MPGGIKAFFKFSERFYPMAFEIEKDFKAKIGERYFYDATFKQSSRQNVIDLEEAEKWPAPNLAY